MTPEKTIVPKEKEFGTKPTIPEKTLELFELKYPLAIFGIDDDWIGIVCKVIQKHNPDNMLLTTYPNLTGADLEIKSKEIEQAYLPNLCVITKPIEMYLEVIAMNRLEKKIRLVVYDENKVGKGWITLEFDE